MAMRVVAGGQARRRKARRFSVALASAVVALVLPSVARAGNTFVTLSFDDGDADQYAIRSVLAAHGMHGTFYITSGTIGLSSDAMTWQQVADLAGDGNEIAGHTVLHPALATLTPDEQKREICDDRENLIAHGYAPTDFAYPFGSFNATTESIVQQCGYDTARGSSTLSDSGPYAESIPPKDPYNLQTTDGVLTGTTLATMEDWVTRAESHGGGWVEIRFHHICDACDPNSITLANFTAFLDWLQPRTANGTVVETTHQVFGGPVNPGVPGPPPPPPGLGLQNGSLETDADGGGVPDCFEQAGYGTNTPTWSRTSDAHTGQFGETLSMTGYSSGARMLRIVLDLGQCSPSVVPGHTYRVTTWYHGSGTIDFWADYRNTAGGWTYFTESSPLPASSTWTQGVWTTPPMPADATAFSYGIALKSNGSVTTDDYTMTDSDQTPPTVSLTAPANGATVSGTVPLSATASDNVAVDHVDFLVDGSVVGTSSTAPYGFLWSSTAVSDGLHTLTARAYDTAGNSTLSAARSVTVANNSGGGGDTTPPVTSAFCNGGSCGAGWYTQPVTVTLVSMDSGGSGVAQTRYTTDGTDPSLTNGTVYSGPFALGASTTLKFRAWDNAGNAEAVETQMLLVDTAPPTTTSTCNGGACGGWYPSAVVALTATDTGGSGVSQTIYTTDGSDPSQSNGTVYTSPFTILATSTVKYRSYDVAGNAEAIETAVVSIDATAPTTTAACNGGACSSGWYTQSVAVSLSATDVGGAGVSSTRYTTDGTDPTLSHGTVYTGAFTLSSSATVKFRSWDRAGNAEQVESVPLRIDKTAPTTSIFCNGSTCASKKYPGHVTVTLTAADNSGGSGVSVTRYTTNGTMPSSSNGITYTGAFTISTTTTVNFYSSDIAGNSEAVKSKQITVR